MPLVGLWGQLFYLSPFSYGHIGSHSRVNLTHRVRGYEWAGFLVLLFRLVSFGPVPMRLRLQCCELSNLELVSSESDSY